MPTRGHEFSQYHNSIFAPMNYLTQRWFPALAMIALFRLSCPAYDDIYERYERDADGWSIIEPSADSRFVYVSSSTGNDATGRPLTAAEVGSDPRLPSIEVPAYQTIAMAVSALRNEGFPDWLLLQAGDTWADPGLHEIPGGRNGYERKVITYYGAAGVRPLLKGNSLGFTSFDKGHDLAIVGVEFHFSGRNPDSPEYTGLTGNNSFFALNNSGNFLLEDCVFRYAKEGLIFQGNSSMMRNCEVRRCIVTHVFRGDGADGLTGKTPDELDHADRSSGTWHQNLDGVLYEDCVFDHNGWNPTKGRGKTIYSHNFYLSSSCLNVVTRNNILSRGASHGAQMRSGGTSENNLFLYNSIALFSAGAKSQKESGNNDILYNVFIGSTNMVPGNGFARGLGITMFAADEGRYEGNLVLERDNPGAISRPAFESTVESGVVLPPGALVQVRRNIIVDWANSSGQSIVIGDNATAYFQVADNIADGLDANGKPVSFQDSARRIEEYMTAIGHPGEGWLDFLRRASERPLRTWSDDYPYSPRNLHAFLREGFTRTGRDFIGLSTHQLQFGKHGGTQTVMVETDQTWTASTEAAWLILTPSAGSGTASLNVTAQPNPAAARRSAAIRLTTAQGDQDFFITQDENRTVRGPQAYFTMDPVAVTLAASGQPVTVGFITSLDWTLQSKPSWVQISPEQGSAGLQSLTISASAYGGAILRSGSVVFASDSSTRSFTIFQQPPPAHYFKKPVWLSYPNQMLWSWQTPDFIWVGAWPFFFDFSQGGSWWYAFPGGTEDNGYYLYHFSDQSFYFGWSALYTAEAPVWVRL